MDDKTRYLGRKLSPVFLPDSFHKIECSLISDSQNHSLTCREQVYVGSVHLGDQNDNATIFLSELAISQLYVNC